MSPTAGVIRRFIPFLRGISPKENIIARLESELFYNVGTAAMLVTTPRGHTSVRRMTRQKSYVEIIYAHRKKDGKLCNIFHQVLFVGELLLHFKHEPNIRFNKCQ